MQVQTRTRVLVLVLVRVRVLVLVLVLERVWWLARRTVVHAGVPSGRWI